MFAPLCFLREACRDDGGQLRVLVRSVQGSLLKRDCRRACSYDGCKGLRSRVLGR